MDINGSSASVRDISIKNPSNYQLSEFPILLNTSTPSEILALLNHGSLKKIPISGGTFPNRSL